METGEGRTPNIAMDLYKLIPELLDRLIELGEISRQIKLILGGSEHQSQEASKRTELID